MLIDKINQIYIEVDNSNRVTMGRSDDWWKGGKVVIYCYYLHGLESGLIKLIHVPLKLAHEKESF